MIGFRVRSASGGWSSSSSRLRGRTAICCRRACTGSRPEPICVRRIAMMIPTLTMIGRRISTGLDLDVRDLADREEADGHHDRADADEDPAERLSEERLHEGGVDRVERDPEAHRKERDEIARHPTPPPDRVDLALVSHPPPDPQPYR